MGHGRRMRDQALHAAQRFGQGEVAQAVDEGAHLGLTAGQFETDHRAEAALLPCRHRVARMRGQAGVVHLAHRGVRGQQFHHRLCVFLVRAQARIQRAQAAQGQERVERRAGEAQRIGPPHQLLVQLGIGGDHRAADHVAVAVDVLGGGVDHQVGAEGDRGLQRRRQEGVVDHRQRAGLVRGVDDEAQVGDAQQRVGRGLDQHQLRRLRQRIGQRARIGQVGGDQFEVALLRQRVEQAPATAVRVVRHHQLVAWLQQRIEHQVDRAHAGGGDHAAGAAFQFRQRFAEQVAGGVAAAGVVVLALVAEAVEAEVRRQHDRRGHRTVGGIAVDAGADRGGGGTTGQIGVVGSAHAATPVGRRAVARIASMRSVSFRKASWP
ncbi:hypothetical protein NB706_003201 [Xanthomonas sacchari]|nr:hypothetical protein [Xanthomonas sacchari]